MLGNEGLLWSWLIWIGLALREIHRMGDWWLRAWRRGNRPLRRFLIGRRHAENSGKLWKKFPLPNAPLDAKTLLARITHLELKKYSNVFFPT